MVKKISFLFLLLGLVISTPLFPNNFIYIVNADGTVAVLDATTYTQIPGSPFPSIASPPSIGQQVTICMSSDGQRVFVPGFQAADTVAALNVDPITGALTPIPGSPVSGFDTPFSSAVRSDNAFVYISNFGMDNIVICDFDLNILGTVLTDSNPAGIIISPDQSHLYIACTGASTVMRFDIIDSAPYLINPLSASIAPGTTPYVIGMDSAGTAVYVTSTGGSISITRFDPDLTNPVQATHGTLNTAIAFSPDQSQLFISSVAAQEVYILDPVTLTALAPAISTGSPYLIAVNPTQNLLYVSNALTSTFSVFDLNQAGYPPIPGTPFSFTPPLYLPYGIAFTAQPLIQPPRNFRGKQKRNNFGFQFELFNRLEWAPPNQGDAAQYILYRNGIEIARLTASTLTYDDHRIEKNTSVVYELIAVSSSGVESAPVTIVVTSG